MLYLLGEKPLGKKLSVKKIALYLLLSSILISCSDNEITPEEQIRQWVTEGVKLAEERKRDSLLEMVHDEYKDGKQRTKKDINRVLFALFAKNKSINLFNRIKSIEVEGKSAKVEIVLAMTAKPEDKSKDIRVLKADLFIFTLNLAYDDIWLLKEASWKRSRDLEKLFLD